MAIQRQLCPQVRLTPANSPAQVVGLDCAFLEQDILAVAVVWNVALRRVVETRGARIPVSFPYVPGLLSFREVPVLLRVLRRVRSDFDALVCDGHGVAHPRRFGLASHVGLIAGKPALGCAKSKLCGEHAAVARIVVTGRVTASWRNRRLRGAYSQPRATGVCERGAFVYP